MSVTVQPPPVLPAAPGNLLAASFTPTGALDRIDTPVGFRSPALGGWRLLAPQCGPGALDTDDHDSAEQGALAQAYPFVIDVYDECTAGWPEQEYRDRAQARLAAVESAAIAHELWTGALTQAAGRASDPGTWLADNTLVDDITPAAGAVKPAYAEALLEGWLGDLLAGPPGVIHATRTVASLLPVQSVDGQIITTRFGTRIVGDAGYPGTGPTGADPAVGEGWAYATARPLILRGPVTVASFAESFDRTQNTVRVHASREALVLIPRAVAAVRVNLTA